MTTMKGQIKKAATPAQYFAALDEERRVEIKALDKLIRKVAPQLKPFVHKGILAYGPIQYRYASGKQGDWFLVGVANNASAISLYCCGADENGWVAEKYKEKLPKAKIGKSCVRFNKLETLDEKALSSMIRETAKIGFHPEKMMRKK